MDTDIFCVLCGGPFALEQHVYNIDPEKESFQWLYNVRLLGTPSALRHHRMTSAGEFHPNLSENDSIFLSETVHWKITDSDCFRLGESFYQVLAGDEAGDALFPLHEACIEIARKIIVSKINAPSDLTNGFTYTFLYENLKERFQAEYYEDKARHEVFALRSVDTRFGPRSVLALDDMHWWSGLYEPMSQSCHDNNPHKASGPLCFIETLPNEILDKITNMLSLQSLMSLRECSRTLAQKIPLNDRFWRKHICDTSILPFLWGLDEKQFKSLLQTAGQHPVDWKGLIRHLVAPEPLSINRVPFGYKDLPKGLWNRRRIWSIIQDRLFSPDPHHRPLMKSSAGQNIDRDLSLDYRKASMILGCTMVFGMAFAWDLKDWSNK